jgi:hypothetical protein
MSGTLPPSPYPFMAFTGITSSHYSHTLLTYKVKLTLKQAMKAQKAVEV